VHPAAEYLQKLGSKRPATACKAMETITQAAGIIAEAARQALAYRA
jgi:hypothetical protein